MKYVLSMTIRNFSCDGFGEDAPYTKMYVSSDKKALEEKEKEIKHDIASKNNEYYWNRIDSSNIFKAEEI